jgi:hypothetical protein
MAKKLKVLNPVGNVKVFVFLDKEGVNNVEFITRGITIDMNAHYSTPRRLREAIRRKRL